MKTPIKVAEKKNIFFGISALIIIAGLLFAMFAGLNMGIDFTGGTIMHISIGKTVEISEIREITDQFDPKASIIHAGDNKDQVIIKTTVDLDNAERTEVLNKFQEKYNLDEENEPLKSDKVSASVSKELQIDALKAMFFAAIAMLLYITVRFEWRFGVAAIVALLHDLFIVVAFYSLLRIPITSSFVAAILTILGYSINDTIVIFDKIRENLKSQKKWKPEELVDVSVSQSLTRSINTSVTTLITIGILYVLGVEDIKTFALPLIIGILSGTYSSIFIASPVWMMLKNMSFKSIKQR